MDVIGSVSIIFIQSLLICSFSGQFRNDAYITGILQGFSVVYTIFSPHCMRGRAVMTAGTARGVKKKLQGKFVCYWSCVCLSLSPCCNGEETKCKINAISQGTNTQVVC